MPRLKHGARRRDAAGARHVLDDEILAELFAELLGDEPRGDVGNAARPERQNDAHRLVGIIRLRPRAAGGETRSPQAQTQNATPSIGASSTAPHSANLPRSSLFDVGKPLAA